MSRTPRLLLLQLNHRIKVFHRFFSSKPKQTPLILVAEKNRAFSSLTSDTREKDSSKVGRSNSLSSVIREASTTAEALECSREATSPLIKDSVWEE
ncbi:hypothetical protein CsSME_00025461 [Camellia sinensis var. sinensis]